MTASPESAPGRRKTPMAIGVVTVAIALAAVGAITLGAISLGLQWHCGALSPQALAQPFQPVLCRPTPGPPLRPVTFVPMEDGVDAVYYLVLGLVLFVLLYGFRHQRHWGWLGLMAWSGLNLFVAIYRYFTMAVDHTDQFVVMALCVFIVLVLNTEEVQLAFGLRQPVTKNPVRDVAAHDGGRL